VIRDGAGTSRNGCWTPKWVLGHSGDARGMSPNGCWTPVGISQGGPQMGARPWHSKLTMAPEGAVEVTQNPKMPPRTQGATEETQHPKVPPGPQHAMVRLSTPRTHQWSQGCRWACRSARRCGRYGVTPTAPSPGSPGLPVPSPRQTASPLPVAVAWQRPAVTEDTRWHLHHRNQAGDTRWHPCPGNRAQDVG